MSKDKIAFKRVNDFWSGFTLSTDIFLIILYVCLDIGIVFKSIIIALLFLSTFMLFYFNRNSKIVSISLKSLMFWKSFKDIENYSLGVDYKTLKEIADSKKILDDLNSDRKVSNFIKNIDKNNKDLWKN